MLEGLDADDAAVFHLRQEGAPMRMVANQPDGHADCLISGTKARSDVVDPPLSVTRGLDPRVHPLRKEMDCRVKSGNDAVGRKVARKPAFGE